MLGLRVQMASEIKITDFSQFPFGRTPKHGPFNGQRFRQERLLPAFRAGNEQVLVDLNGAKGLGPSFLEEAFGGLVREGIPPDEVLSRLVVKSEGDRSFGDLIIRYVREAAARLH